MHVDARAGFLDRRRLGANRRRGETRCRRGKAAQLMAAGNDNVIRLDAHRPRGNGAREALEILFDGDAKFVDILLASLWVAGFKVVPLQESDYD